MAIVHQGYIGSCKITSGGNGGQFFIQSSSLNPVQDLNVPDMIQGRYTNYLYNWGKIETGGNVQGPAFDSTGGAGGDASLFWEWAKKRDATNPDRMQYGDLEIEIYYFNAAGRRFENCQVNSFEVSCTAGDVANFTLDFMGAGSAGTGVTGITGSSEPAQGLMRLITWDVCKFTTGNVDIDGAIESFSLNLSNNLERKYAVGAPKGEGYAPFDVVAGVQKLTGSLTVYAQGAPGDNDAQDNFFNSQTGSIGSPVTIEIGSAGSFINIPAPGIQVAFKRDQAQAKTDSVTYSVDFQALAFDNLI